MPLYRSQHSARIPPPFGNSGQSRRKSGDMCHSAPAHDIRPIGFDAAAALAIHRREGRIVQPHRLTQPSLRSAPRRGIAGCRSRPVAEVRDNHKQVCCWGPRSSWDALTLSGAVWRQSYPVCAELIRSAHNSPRMAATIAGTARASVVISTWLSSGTTVTTASGRTA